MTSASSLQPKAFWLLLGWTGLEAEEEESPLEEDKKKGILGTIVHVIVAIVVFITTVTISLVIATKNGIINCADIKRQRQRIFATTTFAMEMWMRCMGFSGS
jgi:hypothetical protein